MCDIVYYGSNLKLRSRATHETIPDRNGFWCNSDKTHDEDINENHWIGWVKYRLL